VFKVLLTLCVIVQIYVGGYYLKTSSVAEEQNFVGILFNHNENGTYTDDMDVAMYLGSLPSASRVLIDDAIAYPIVAFTADIKPLIMPYQGNFLSALESPDKFVDYVVMSSSKSLVSGYSQLNNKYMISIKRNNSAIDFRKVYETTNWVVYRVVSL
jgi:hypothetical protein